MEEGYKVAVKLIEDNKEWIYERLMEEQLIFDDDFDVVLIRPIENCLTEGIEKVLQIKCIRRCCETEDGWRGAICGLDVYEQISDCIDDIIKCHYSFK